MRTSGILMHISSLPSRYGIGTLGKEAYRFIDFLEKSGQTYWQILPIGPTSFGDSPYSSPSTYAGNPYFIDLEVLVEEGLLSQEDLRDEDFGDHPSKVNYGLLYQHRFEVLRKACDALLTHSKKEYTAFCRQNAFWLPDYALFMAIKEHLGGGSWQDWPQELKRQDAKVLKQYSKLLSKEIEFYQVQQYLFYLQWHQLKAYANEKHIQIIGDLPIYVSLDSADVWSNPSCFLLDEEYKPLCVAGCPPDAFSDDGQLWGNPIYNWSKLKETGYAWWIERIRHATKVYDVVRIDHFRGFEAYWSIPYGDINAKRGKWIKGPDYDLFRAIKEQLGDLPIIAEDLGTLTPAVYKLMKRVGYPGMKVLQFAFSPNPNEENEYLPCNMNRNSVAYVGTHDNDTAIGWLKNTDPEVSSYAKAYMHLTEEEGLSWGMIRTLLACPADTAIMTMQDILAIGEEGRMNMPSTCGDNWAWRVRHECINDWLAGILYEKTTLYKRLNPSKLAVLKEEQSSDTTT